jgi:carbon storage regulator
MLALTRKVGDSILIGDEVELFITDLGKSSVTLAIKAPKEVAIRRGQVAATPKERVRLGDGQTASRSRGSNGHRARGRRRVVIEAPLAATPEKRVGSAMLRQALTAASPEVIESLVRGDAIDTDIRRALMELAREELSSRRRARVSGRR